MIERLQRNVYGRSLQQNQEACHLKAITSQNMKQRIPHSQWQQSQENYLKRILTNMYKILMESNIKAFLLIQPDVPNKSSSETYSLMGNRRLQRCELSLNYLLIQCLTCRCQDDHQVQIADFHSPNQLSITIERRGAEINSKI